MGCDIEGGGGEARLSDPIPYNPIQSIESDRYQWKVIVGRKKGLDRSTMETYPPDDIPTHPLAQQQNETHAVAEKSNTRQHSS